MDLAQARGADGLPVGDQAAVGVHRKAAPDLGGAFRKQRLLLAVLAEHVLGHVDHLRACIGVLQLHDVHVLWAETGDLVGRARRVDRGRI